ncbi:MAG: hypothetical protein OHK0015_21780 [Chloroflexi bacterium OHK40]
MCQPVPPAAPATRWRVVLFVLVMLVLGGCGFFGGGCGLGPGASATPTPAASGQQIVITAPSSGATVTSPILVNGTTAVSPFENTLNYRLFGLDGALLAEGFFTTQGELGGPGVFAGEVPYTLGATGPGRLEVIEFSAADGSIRAIASVNLTLGPGQAPPATALPGAPTPTALPPPPPSAQQQIFIDSPPPGTVVGSPVVITGRTVRQPAGNSLSYTMRDAAGGVLGSGTFPVSMAAGDTGSFNASLTFNLPPNGGGIVLELFEPGQPGAPPLASATLAMQVAPPQAILIDSPPPGTTVGSPVVITGRTARFPFQGNLGYRVLDASGRQLGLGTFPVAGAQGGPASFNASINFSLPPSGGRITVEIFDQNAANSQIAAAARIELNVAPPQQAIIIETPPANTVVGSPMTITGRVVRLPAGGALTYRVRDRNGQQIGQGQFGVVGSQDGGARFNAQVLFTLPPGGGPITVELLEIDPANGQVRTSATLALQVAGPPPTATLTPLPSSQAITIDTPPQGTVVGSPVVITGRTTLPPRTSELFYVVRTLTRETLGQGSFPVAVRPGQSADIPFVASLTFAEPPQGGAIVVEIYDRDAVGQIIASAIVQLQVNPRNPPTPTAPTGGGQVGRQELFIETPPPGTVVGSPVVITGRTTLPPLNGELDYQVIDPAGTVLGSGSFTVPIPADTARTPFVASITFAEPPQGGTIIVIIADTDNGTGAIRAQARVELTVAALPYPLPQPRTGP